MNNKNIIIAVLFSVNIFFPVSCSFFTEKAIIKNAGHISRKGGDEIIENYDIGGERNSNAGRIADESDDYFMDHAGPKDRHSKHKIQDYYFERDRNYIKIKSHLLGNKYAQAEDDLSGFASRYPEEKKSREYHYYMGIFYENKGEKVKAIQEYSEAVSICPNYSRAWNRMGYLYASMRQYNRAEDCFMKAVESNPYNPFILFNTGNFYFNINDKKNADEYLRRAIKCRANFDEAYYKLGIIMYQNEEYSEAVKNFSMALKFKMESPNLYYYIGSCYFEMDQRELAISNLEKAIGMKGDFFEAYVRLGKIYQEHGEYDRAIASYAKAEKSRPGFRDLKIWTAECYEETERYDTAMNILHGLLKTAPDNEDLNSRIRKLTEKKYNSNLKQKRDYLNY